MSHEVLTVGPAPGLKAKMEMKDVAAGSKVQISNRMKKKSIHSKYILIMSL